MTVAAAVRKAGPLTGNGVSTLFPFTFKVFQASDLLVVQTDLSGVETTQTLTTQYTVSLNSNQDSNPGGTVTMLTAPASGYLITIGSQVPQSQLTVLTNTGGFYPTVINDMLDRVTILVQQLSEKLGRALSLPFSAPAGTSLTLPLPQSSNLIGWNSAANGLQNVDPVTMATLVAFGTAKSDIFTGDGATTTFTLSASPGVLANLDVAVAGATKLPGVDYFWTSGTTLTFASAPANGTKVLARYLQALPQGTSDSASSTYTPSGTGAVATTVQQQLRNIQANYINVKDAPFYAKGDGAIVGGVLTGTNDTAAFNAAIAACGNSKILYVPSGTYILTPGAGSQIRCSVEAPDAIAIASTDTTLGALFDLAYDETYPVALGTSNTGLYAWKTFRWHQIIGSPNGDSAFSNVGIHCSYLNESQVIVDVIRGCNRGIHLDGNALNTHQGTNYIDIGHMYMCDVGFLGQGGTAGNMCEANRVTGRYWYGFRTAAISLAGGGTAVRVDNEFDIVSLGVGIANGNGIMLDSLCSHNVFRIRSWDAGVSGTGKYIVSSGANNLFQVPSLVQAAVTMTGTDIIDLATWAQDGSGRSNLNMSGVPSSGSWRKGDKVWNTAPNAGNVPGWVCTTAGTPGTWTEMQVLAGSPKFKAFMASSQGVTVNTPTGAVFGNATANVTASYNAANGVFQPSVPGYYQVSTSLKVAGTTMTSAALELYKNGSLDTTLMVMPTTLNNSVLSGSSLVYLNGTTDTLAVFGTVTAASGASFVSGAFSAALIQST